jgi:hypothetical protein
LPLNSKRKELMNYCISSAVFERFPGYLRGIVLVAAADNSIQSERFISNGKAASISLATAPKAIQFENFGHGRWTLWRRMWPMSSFRVTRRRPGYSDYNFVIGSSACAVWGWRVRSDGTGSAQQSEELCHVKCRICDRVLPAQNYW